MFYRFGVNNDGTVYLTTFNQGHSHPPNLSPRAELTDGMKLEISRFNTEIKDHIEKTFNCKMMYATIYNEFKRQFPRLGPEDCQKFIDFLDINNCSYKSCVGENRALSRLLFITPAMQNHYTKYSDILLIDSTYQTNFYSIPLVILSGVNNNYQNILFGIGLINDENTETYSWLLEEFCQLNNNKKPEIVISDSEHAIVSAIEGVLKDVPHRLCAWHIVKNLRRNFNFIKSENEELKNKIFKLPFLRDKTIFDQYTTDIIKFLTDNDLKKSKAYFDKVLERKDKWAPSCHESFFDGGITTTSRAESWNSHIKKYLNSKSEIWDLVEFILDVEGTNFIEKDRFNVEVLRYLELDPLVAGLKAFLPPRIYAKQLQHYSFGKRYESALTSKEGEVPTYNVPGTGVENGVEPKQHQSYTVTVGQYITCTCHFFKELALYVRIFFISVLFGMSSLLTA